MKLVVIDANVFIYLSQLDLVESFMSMDFEIHTTEFIIDEYYRGKTKEINLKSLEKYRKKNRLAVHDLEYNELAEIYNENKKTFNS